MRPRVAGFSALLLTLTLAVAPARAEIIDRILAVVEDQLITLSDVRGVIRLGLERVPPADDQVAAALERLIERQLMLVEVERFAPPEPPPEVVDARVNALRARFPDQPAFDAALQQTGWPIDAVTRYMRDSLRIESYLQQRFTAAIQPSDDEIAAYYRLHANDFTKGGVLAPYAEVRNQVRAQLVEERRAALVRDWLSGLRRRANLLLLYLPAAATPG
jgi:peptidyl-prolyl cis-trans isomerase SurA